MSPRIGAILPAAGLGKRMASLTGGHPKELLPLGGRTVIDLVLDEALRTCEVAAVVTSPGKPEIARGVEGRATVAYQDSPRGFAHAVRIGMDALPPCDAYLALLPDNVFPTPGPSTVLADRLMLGADFALLAEVVGDEQVSRYGILEVDEELNIHRILEKPSPSETSSRLAVGGRYGFNARFAEFLREACDRHSQEAPELSLTPAMGMAVGVLRGVAVPMLGMERYDCGTPEGYAEAVRRFA